MSKLILLSFILSSPLQAQLTYEKKCLRSLTNINEFLLVDASLNRSSGLHRNLLILGTFTGEEFCRNNLSYPNHIDLPSKPIFPDDLATSLECFQSLAGETEYLVHFVINRRSGLKVSGFVLNEFSGPYCSQWLQ